MSDPNMNVPEWDVSRDDPPFASRAMRLAAHAGAKEIGATLYEVDPGGAVAPYHAHHGNEELLIVLSGTPQLRTPDGVRTLQPGAAVSFPRGTEGAHRVSNAADEPARLLIVSTMNVPDIAEYPDTGTWLAMTGPAEGKAFPAGCELSVLESVMQAMQAATEHDKPAD
jgi:uncharacterized cupin superfamily protein